MLYRPIWLTIVFLFRLYFKRWFISGKHNWINNKPVIMTWNHVNAFVDPIIWPSLIIKKVMFIVRGDIFNTPFKRWLLWQMRQIPMWRQRDGIDSMRKNEESFERCYKYLSQGEAIEIFSEGDCVQEKHLRPIKKGTARMAFGTIERYGWDIDLQIMPSTVNYTHPSKFRSEIIVRIGKPISLLDYKEAYDENPNRAVNLLTKDIYLRMKENYIQMDDRQDLQVFEDLIRIKRSTQALTIIPWLTYGDDRYLLEKSLSDKINDFRQNAPEKLDQIAEKAREYSLLLQKLRLNDHVFGTNSPGLFTGWIFSTLFLPIFLIGYAVGILPYRFVDNFVNKKIKLVHFKSSIRFGLFFALGYVISIAAMIVGFFIIGWYGLLVPLAFFVILYVTLYYSEYVRNLLKKHRAIGLKRNKPEVYEDLIQRRIELSKWIFD